MRIPTSGFILFLSLALPLAPLSAYPPPPGTHTESPTSADSWQLETDNRLEEASSLYSAGINTYLTGEYEQAASRFRDALDLLATPESDGNAPVSDEEDLLRRKIAYLLGKVSGNGENETYWFEGRWDPGPPMETADASSQTGVLPEFSILSNGQTERWIQYFREDASDRFTTYLERSGRYESMMRKTLRAHGLPDDLVYLPLIESGFNPRAYSVAHAAGVWQFIRSTAKRCGLRVDYWVDERRDPEKSCEAAALHLRYLWEMFESWPLVLAAYNAGEKRVMDAILAGGTRDYWKLRLPRQTREYVPRFMAGATIARNPEAHEFHIDYQPPLTYEIFEVDQATDLELIARCSGSTLSALKDLNPHLRRGCTPPGEDGYPVMIPPGTRESCEANFFRIPKKERLASQSQFTIHRVRRGETLSHIARRYGTTVSNLVAANNLKSPNLIREGQKLTVPTPGSGRGWESAAAALPEDSEKIVYVVRRGDTLDAIARAHNTRVDHLRKWNGLGRNQYIIHPGDRLLIFLPGDS
jgi:membrane-bound lytic murein transglycosylase D